MASIPVEITAAVVGIFAAVIGYAFRELRNRISPFFDIITINGGLMRFNDEIAVPQEVLDALKDSFYIADLKPESELGITYQAWDQCDDMKKVWPAVKKRIEAVLTAATDDDLLGSLGTLLNGNYFEKWITLLLLRNRLDFEVNEDITNSPEKIHVWIEEKDDEQVWFDFPNKAVSFGKRLGHPAIRAKFMPFILAVTHLHKAGLQKALREMIRILDEDYRKALSAVHELKEINDANSRWAFYCFLANNSPNPILIETSGAITAVDNKTRTKYHENCYVTLSDENFDLKDTSIPLIVKVGESVQFCLVTNQKQREMKLGDAMREAFERADGLCRATVTTRRVGLVKRQRCRSLTARFVQHGKDKQNIS